MTGAEFKAAIAAAGYNQLSFATKMGVHRDTIGRLDADKEVSAYWVYALAGLLASQTANDITSIVARIVSVSDVAPSKPGRKS